MADIHEHFNKMFNRFTQCNAQYTCTHTNTYVYTHIIAHMHAQAVQGELLPLPKGWSSRVVGDLGDLGSLEEMLGKQVGGW